MSVYKNNPILEASCEISFDPGSPWDLAVAGMFFEQVKNEFPKRKSAQALETSMAQQPDATQHQFKVVDRLQCWAADEKTLLQVSQNFVCANTLAPYCGWVHFKPMIEKALETYSRLSGASKIERVAMRYIDKIALPLTATEVTATDHWFKFYSHGPEFPSLGRPPAVGIFIAHQYSLEEERDVLMVELSSAGGDDTYGYFMLDTKYVLAKPAGVELDGMSEWLDLAHSRLIDAFEGSISDNLRKIFDGEYNASA